MKRGLSTIITTLIIILLSFIAIGIVWVVVQNVIKTSTEDLQYSSLNVNLEISKVQIINQTSLTVSVKRNPGIGDINGIKIIAFDGTNSQIFDWNGTINELDTIPLPITTYLGDTTNIKKISVAPIFTTPKGEIRVGDIKDAEEISSGGTLPPGPVGPIINNFVYITFLPALNLGRLSWDINESSNSTIEYGLTSAYGSTQIFNSYVIHQQADFMGLTLGTIYHYKVTSCSFTTHLCTTTSDRTFTHQAP